MDILETIGTGGRDDMRGRLQSWLGVTDEVSDQALAAVIISPTYARKMTLVRGHHGAVRHLLAHPPQAPVSVLDTMRAPPAALPERKAHSLGHSALKWIENGMRRADQDTRDRRWEACMACPHLQDRGAGALHKLTALAIKNAKTCGICGCNVRAKGAVATETCPDAHPEMKGLSRWAEQI